MGKKMRLEKWVVVAFAVKLQKSAFSHLQHFLGSTNIICPLLAPHFGIIKAYVAMKTLPFFTYDVFSPNRKL